MKRFIRQIAVLLVLCMVFGCAAFAEEATQSDRVTFFLLCNESMNNDRGNVGNTMMAVSFDPNDGTIRLLVFTWDTFINYEGYDTPQLIDQPFRNNGAEESRDVFNANFNQNIQNFVSVNYLNLATIIDAFGGVTVDVTRAERNALNGMVSSKQKQLTAAADMGLLEQAAVEMLASDYYLNEWGENTHLNGLQAVAYGWLQYDSVYNCCQREVYVISDLFASVSETINNAVAFWMDSTGEPDDAGSRRVINLDHMTEDDEAYLLEMVSPIFESSYNNLSEEDILTISVALAKNAYTSARQGHNVLENVNFTILPLEAQDVYDIVAGREGHIVDYEANAAAITEFLFGE